MTLTAAATTTAPLLSAHGVGRRHAQATILQGIDLSVR